MPKYKINFEIAEEIRKDWNTGNYKQRQLSEKYGIPQNAINKVVNFEIWVNKERQTRFVTGADEATKDRLNVENGFCQCQITWRKALIA